jgi:single-strand DNA-binding protein
MATYELTGTVKAIMDEMKFPSGFSKREFVVMTDDDRYPQPIKFECVKERGALLETVKPGQRVTVSFDIRGNESKGRYFVSLAVWKIEAASAKTGQGQEEEDRPLDEAEPSDNESGKDLPF